MMEQNIKDFLDDIFFVHSIDAEDIENLGVKHGLLIEEIVKEPCGEDCSCAEYGDFPTTCYKKNYGIPDK